MMAARTPLPLEPEKPSNWTAPASRHLRALFVWAGECGEPVPWRSDARQSIFDCGRRVCKLANDRNGLGPSEPHRTAAGIGRVHSFTATNPTGRVAPERRSKLTRTGRPRPLTGAGRCIRRHDRARDTSLKAFRVFGFAFTYPFPYRATV